MSNQFSDIKKQNLSNPKTTTPRGRGRPKGSLNKNTVNAELVSAGTLSTNTPTTTPKGRGRPKGSLNKNTVNAEFVTADTLSTNTPTTTPKARGRPKGSLNKFKKQNLNDVNEDILKTVPSFTIIMGGPDDGMPRKDGRGRPKAGFDGPGQAGVH